jgi:hypothetical protein
MYIYILTARCGFKYKIYMNWKLNLKINLIFLIFKINLKASYAVLSLVSEDGPIRVETCSGT